MDNETKASPETSSIETLLSNKEFLSRLSEIAKDLKSNAEGSPDSPAAEVAATPPNESPPLPTSPAADALSSALSNPDLMAKLPEVVAALSSASGTSTPQKTTSDKRTALLRALRPYLSESRCEAIDYITRVEKLGDLLKNLNLQ